MWGFKNHREQAVLLLLIFFFNGLFGQENSVRINEFLAINDQVLVDEDGQYSDWIELYNEGPGAVQLSGWSLTDDPALPGKWSFPDVEIPSNGFLLVFASGKDRGAAGAELHTNFKLSGAGEYLSLRDSEGTLMTAFDPSYPVQQGDISFGYSEGIYVSFTQPSPGYANDLESALIPPPQLTVNHGIFVDPFYLEILNEFEGVDIFYTTDGSRPHIGNGTYYLAPVLIDTTTIIRAVAVLDDISYSTVVTRSYIFPENIINQPNNPPGYPSEWGPYTAIQGTSIADYEMDPELLADPLFASSVVEGLKSLPTLSLVTDMDNLFSHSTDPETGGIYIYTGPPLSRTEDGLGKGWERPASIEYFNTEGTESFQVNCGVRIQGGHSRRPEKSPKHSFRLVFKSEYGPTRLNYPLFKDEDAVSSFNSLILRAGFGLSWIHHSHYERQQAQYQRDIWSKDTQRAMGHPSSHSEYTHLYINGIYWGIYAPSERMDSDFAASYMEGDPEEYDVIKDYQDVANGEITAWNKLMDMANAGLVDQESYHKIQGNNPDGSPNPGYEAMVDVKNLADYMLINFYGGNTDWDHHNWAAMRNRVNPGTGFKFFSWDTEHLLKSVSTNVLDENNDYCPSRVFQQLRENEEFRWLFADRVQQLCFNEGLLTPGPTAERWNKRTGQVEPSIVAEAARWGDYRKDVHPFQSQGPFDLYNYDNYWIPQQSYMLNTYFPDRTAAFLYHLRSAGLYPLIEAPQFFINGESYPVEEISRGDQLSMSSGEGIIYYTENGKDPADWAFDSESQQTTLIAGDATKYVMVPKSDLGTQWISDLAFDHGSWSLCSGAPGGIGYERGNGYQDQITLDVGGDMYADGDNPNNSCYVRIPFTIQAGDLEELKALLLNIRYDDGFTAFLNGIRVAEANAPMDLQWNSVSSNTHEATSEEIFDLSAHLSLLQEGENLLAIHGLNEKTSSSDFLLSVSLIAGDQVSAGISEDALMYSESISLDHSVHIMARTYLEGNWSAAMKSFITFPEDLKDIKLTEIHYNPLVDGDMASSGYEFVELKNTGSSTLDLGGLSFVEGIDYTFSAETGLIPGAFVVLASDEMNFYESYGFMPGGEYKGNLNNAGERLRLESTEGDSIILVLYGNSAPWPEMADGYGYSLVPTVFNPVEDQNDPQNWRSSYHIGGSPGRDDTESTSTEEQAEEAGDYLMGQNYPNPFTEVTHINYILPVESHVDLSVYNLMGQKVAILVSGRQSQGSHVVSWNGMDEAGEQIKEGIYIYRMIIKSKDGIQSVTKKMIKF